MPITTEQDLLNLVAAGTQENLSLEFKRCDALQNTDVKKDELSKDVSAFANSAGGELIYGIIEDINLPTAIDVGFDAMGPIKREWIEQVISSRIQPRIQGIVIRPIVLTNPKSGSCIGEDVGPLFGVCERLFEVGFAAENGGRANADRKLSVAFAGETRLFSKSSATRGAMREVERNLQRFNK